MPYQHILIAVDLTDECHPVVERALAIAASSGAKAALVHIVEPMAMAFGGDVPMDLSLLQQQQFDQARERLQSFAGRYPQLGAEQRHLAYGQPRQELHRLAEEQGCDLIVVGSHGRHGLALLLGSTANDVLHGAPCDVLAVRLKKTKE
ncbi:MULTISPECIES: universal stress protein [Pseudomonadaceae]|jgi:universal stress protein A|uniref:Universal stress protein n=1 Tax=Aquipseudomonas alcaligenes TaxID=43263 RepID=A0A142IT88_AQUAC|nr:MULTISPECIES: universal stress protein [Pseudomonas]AMR67520.1 universal stress protein UspA [Pseudomonas alcaligenes]MDC7824631.1 universal stress protein [Pseudomonas sp. BLCC-B13]MDH0140865.1 universal stress protein [Pseudomonas alcaligenes]MDH1055111.1 universal stress protein [Pseudomonas alcaligenes]NMY39923.1 universal stress protein [Pseudomonas sp. WS 5013]